MRCLVVSCHPCAESFVAAMAATVTSTLETGGHSVRRIDLYESGFQPAMGAAERRAYHDPAVNRRGLEDHIEALSAAEAVYFVYPTWWYGLPAMLKGWLDRVLVPDFAFLMPTEEHGIKGNLRHIRKVSVITSCGASWLVSKIMGEPGRKTLLRGFRSICHPLTRTRYLAIYTMDTQTAENRAAYLDRIRRVIGRD